MKAAFTSSDAVKLVPELPADKEALDRLLSDFGGEVLCTVERPAASEIGTVRLHLTKKPVEAPKPEPVVEAPKPTIEVIPEEPVLSPLRDTVTEKARKTEKSRKARPKMKAVKRAKAKVR